MLLISQMDIFRFYIFLPFGLLDMHLITMIAISKSTPSYLLGLGYILRISLMDIFRYYTILPRVHAFDFCDGYFQILQLPTSWAWVLAFDFSDDYFEISNYNSRPLTDSVYLWQYYDWQTVHRTCVRKELRIKPMTK